MPCVRTKKLVDEKLATVEVERLLNNRKPLYATLCFKG